MRPCFGLSQRCSVYMGGLYCSVVNDTVPSLQDRHLCLSAEHQGRRTRHQPDGRRHREWLQLSQRISSACWRSIEVTLGFCSRSSSTTATGTPPWTSRPWTGPTGWARPSRSRSTASSARAPSRRGSCRGPRRRARSETQTRLLTIHATAPALLQM